MLLTHRRNEGQVVVLLVIVLAILGGGFWWLVRSTKAREKEAADFARQAAVELAFHFNQKFLDIRIASDMQTRFPPSFRERMLNHLRELGVPTAEPEVTGTVEFTNHFFDPHGRFQAHLVYPTRTAEIYLAVSCPKGWWQIDDLNFSWDLPAETPAASPGPKPAEAF